MVKVAAKASVDRIFKAFADPTRLRILNLLRMQGSTSRGNKSAMNASGELCVCDLVRIIRAPQPKISRHLAYLRRAGLVTGRRDGLWMFYGLATAKSEFHQRLLNCLACCFKDVPELARDAEQLGGAGEKGAREEGSCCE